MLPAGLGQLHLAFLNRFRYLLPVKENQPRLLDSLQLLFNDPEEMRWAECVHHRTVDKGHGRIEIRECWTSSDPEYLRHFALNLLRREKTAKRSLKGKRMKAAWDKDYLLKVLAG